MPLDGYSIHDAGSDPQGGRKQEIFQGAVGGEPVKALAAEAVSRQYGNSYEMDPYEESEEVTFAHGLPGHPDGVDIYLECGTAEQGYAVGDRSYQIDPFTLTFSAGAADLYLATRGSRTPNVIHRTSNDDSSVQITANRWKLVCRPYKYL